MPERFHNRMRLEERRKRLRNRATPAERALWQMLRRRQLEGRKFRCQHSLGPFIVDFCCPAERLAVELDGAVHDDPARAAYDAGRHAFLRKEGVRVVRFENRQVFEQPDMVRAGIAHHFEEAPG